MLQGLAALPLEQEQATRVQVVLPAVLAQGPGVQVLEEGPVQPALLVRKAGLTVLLAHVCCYANSFLSSNRVQNRCKIN